MKRRRWRKSKETPPVGKARRSQLLTTYGAGSMIDLVDRSIQFIADSKQIDPDKPFYLHLCFGATHAPHHAPKEWADKYAGKFDDGWDAYRERTFARQKELGIVPADANLSRHDPDVPAWETLPEPARKLFSRVTTMKASTNLRFMGGLSATEWKVAKQAPCRHPATQHAARQRSCLCGVCRPPSAYRLQ